MGERSVDVGVAPRARRRRSPARLWMRGIIRSEMYAHLTAADQQFPQWPTVNPPRWKSATSAGSRSSGAAVTRTDDPRGVRTPPRIPEADAWWDSSRVPHDTRWSLPLPAWDGIHAYLDATLADTLAALAASRDGERYFFELALYHEDMHIEALADDAADAGAAIAAGVPAGRARRIRLTPVDAADIQFSGGPMLLGSRREEAAKRFVFDNEKWSHPVMLAPFAMARCCVTNAQFLAFVEAGATRGASTLVGGRLAVAASPTRCASRLLAPGRERLAPAAI